MKEQDEIEEELRIRAFVQALDLAIYLCRPEAASVLEALLDMKSAAVSEMSR